MPDMYECPVDQLMGMLSEIQKADTHFFLNLFAVAQILIHNNCNQRGHDLYSHLT